MNRCPKCQKLVPAGWIACRGCGAALPVGRNGGGTATPTRAATGTVVHLATVRDTLLPGGASAPLAPPRPVERDSLIPGHKAPPPITRRRFDNRLLFAGAGAIVALVAAWMFWPSPGPSSKDRVAAEARARRATDIAHAFYAKDKNYNRVTEANIADRISDAHVVDAGKGAQNDQISVWVDGHTVIAATALGTHGCLFARTDPKTTVVQHATGSEPCAASTAPKKGWST